MPSFQDRWAAEIDEVPASKAKPSFSERWAAGLAETEKEITSLPKPKSLSEQEKELWSYGSEKIGNKWYHSGEIEDIRQDLNETNRKYRADPGTEDLSWDDKEYLDETWKKRYGKATGRTWEDVYLRDLTQDEVRSLLSKGKASPPSTLLRYAQGVEQGFGAVFEASPLNWATRAADAVLQNVGYGPAFREDSEGKTVKRGGLNPFAYALGVQDEDGEYVPYEDVRKLFGFIPRPEGKGILQILHADQAGIHDPMAEIAAFGMLGFGLKITKAKSAPALRHLRMKAETPFLRYGLDKAPLPAEVAILDIINPNLNKAGKLSREAAARKFRDLKPDKRKALPVPRRETRFAVDEAGTAFDVPAGVRRSGEFIRTAMNQAKEFKRPIERKALPVPKEKVQFISDLKLGIRDLKREAIKEKEFVEKGYDISTQDLGVADMLAREQYAAAIQNAMAIAAKGKEALKRKEITAKKFGQTLLRARERVEAFALKAHATAVMKETKAFMNKVEADKVKRVDKGQRKQSQVEAAAGEFGALDITVLFDAAKAFIRASEKMVRLPLKGMRVVEDVALFPYRYAIRKPVQTMITKGLETPVLGDVMRGFMPLSSRVGQLGITALDAIRFQNEFQIGQRRAAMWGKDLRHTFRKVGVDIPTGLETSKGPTKWRVTLRTDRDALRAAYEYARAITYDDWAAKSQWRRQLTREQRAHVETTMREVKSLNYELSKLGMKRESTLLEYPDGILRDIYGSKAVHPNRPSGKMKQTKENVRKDAYGVHLRMNEDIALKFTEEGTVVNSGYRSGNTFIKFTTEVARDAYLERLKQEGLRKAARPEKFNPSTQVERESAGVISDYRIAGEETLAMLRGRVAVSKYQRRVAKEPNLVSDVQTPKHTKQLPDDHAYGPIAGKWSNDTLYDSLMTLHGVENFYFEVMGALRSPWKQMKVTLEPRAHARQLLGNILASPLSGASPLNPLNWPYYLMAAGDIVTKNSRWRESVRRGVSNADFAASELGFNRYLSRQRPESIGEAFVWYLNRASQNPVSRKIGEIYGWGDSLFRHAHYLKLTKGLNIPGAKAAQEVNRVWPHYGEVGKLVAQASKSPPMGAFGRFRAEEMKAFFNAAMDNPHRLAGYMLIPSIAQSIGKTMFGYSDADLQAWREKYGYFFTPVGKNTVMNLGYGAWIYDHFASLGIGAREELMDREGFKGKLWNWLQPFIEGPEVGILAAAVGLDTFRRKKIGEAWEEDDEAAWDLVAQIILPSWAGGRTQKRLKNQMETGVDRYGNKLNPAHTYLDAFAGLIVQEFKHSTEKKKLAFEFVGKMNELSRGMIKAMADPSILKSEKLRRKNRIIERLERLKADYDQRLRSVMKSEQSESGE